MAEEVYFSPRPNWRRMNVLRTVATLAAACGVALGLWALAIIIVIGLAP